MEEIEEHGPLLTQPGIHVGNTQAHMGHGIPAHPQNEYINETDRALIESLLKELRW